MDIFNAIKRVYFFGVIIRVDYSDISEFVLNCQSKVDWKISGSELVILPK